MRTGFVGGGNMAQAIAGGLLAQGAQPQGLMAIEPADAAQAFWRRRGLQVFASFDAAMLDVDVLVLAVKPQVMAGALAPFRGRLRGQLVLSIAAGVRVADLARWLGAPGQPYPHVVRSMPNTPALAGAGMTGLHAPAALGADHRTMAASLLQSVGQVAWFDDEAMLDAVTAVSGSGPAYVFYFIEALEQAALEMGMAEDTARLLARQTFLGGARLAAESAESAAALRAKVTSPRGTTERAIASFESAGLKARFIEGVLAARTRATELGNEMSAVQEDPPPC
ncbi:MAG: pyrroline-5-carboxylate reductase [Betaproteobacteria bacterium]|nr:pyrroline-5-carboxylate reductase [Betaproteobacteria bacterium]